MPRKPSADATPSPLISGESLSGPPMAIPSQGEEEVDRCFSTRLDISDFIPLASNEWSRSTMASLSFFHAGF